MVASTATHELHADAFRQLYPAQYYAGFLSKHIRPDGRQLSESRPTTIGVDTIKSADSSALVKTGSTTVVAGIILEKLTGLEDEAAPDRALVINVEMAAFSSADARPGRPSEAAQCICMQMEQALEAVLDSSQLHQEEAAAWRLQLDVYVLDADGSLLDSCLLAAVAALLALRLPRAALTGGDCDQPEQHLRMGALPLSSTFATVGDHLLADPTAEEEAQAGSLMSMTTDARGSLTGLHKTGGAAAASPAQLQECKTLACTRHRELAVLLEEALRAAERVNTSLVVH